MKPSSRHSRRRAFTLVEIVLALGISSFSMVVMLGLLQMGLTRFHDAIEDSAHARINRKLLDEAEMSDFSSLTSARYIDSFPRYYSDEGLAVSPAEARYVVHAILRHNGITRTSLDPAPPGIGALPGGIDSARLAHILFRTRSEPGQGPPFSMMTVIADNGR